MDAECMGVDFKKTGLFAVIVLGTTAIVTLIFGLIFGFDRWQRNVTTASQLMTAAAVMPAAPPPSANPYAAGQYVCPVHGAVGLPQFDAGGMPHCPIDGQQMAFQGAANMALAAGAG